MSTLSQQLAGFLADTQLDDIPASVRERVTQDLLDITGCIVFGFGERIPWTERILDYVRSLDERPRATVLGTGLRVSPGSAALAMGLSAHAFELDDYHAGAKLHAAAVVAPVVFALGESIGARGEEVLLAATLGMEVMIRLGLALDSVATMLNGFHLTGICGSVAGAAAAAKLLGLSAPQTAHALGLGATQASGLMGFLHDGSDSKRLHAGRAAENGIVAAQLASRGMTGPPRVFELEHGGFCHAFSPKPSPGQLVEDLGRHWTADEISLKRYPVCGAIHSTIDSVRKALAEAGADAIESVNVGHSPAIVQQNGWRYEPSDTLHAQMSMRYCVAATLLEGELLPRQFRDELLDDPRVLELVQRVDVTPDDRVAAIYPHKSASHVTVRLKDGRTLDYFAETPKGSPQDPMTFGEVEEKFTRLTAGILDPEQRRAVVAALANVRALPSLDPLLQALRPRDAVLTPA